MPYPDGLLICGQTTQLVGPMAKWPGESPDLPWYYDLSGYRGTLTREQLTDVFTRAWKYWSDVADIWPRMVGSKAEAKVWGTFQRIDGPSNVLAWSMLANGDDEPKEQRFDAGDTWVAMNPEQPSGGIDLVRVACHEIGHVLGLEHDASNADALLRPSYSTSIPGPTARDIQRLIGLGYKARTDVTPDPPPVTGVRLALPGGGRLTADFPTKVITYPVGWVGRNV